MESYKYRFIYFEKEVETKTTEITLKNKRIASLDDELRSKIEELGGLRTALYVAKDDIAEEKNKIYKYVAEKKVAEV